MSAASNYLEKAVLDHVLKNTAMSQPSGLYLALFTGTAADVKGRLEAGTLTDEVTGTNYARKNINVNGSSGAFDAANSTTGTTSNTQTVTFDAAGSGGWGTITCVAVMDASTAGHVLFYGEVTTAKTIDQGDTFQVSAGNLTISLA